MQVFWQAKFWVYHYHVILLPLSLLAAAGVDTILRQAGCWPRFRIPLLALVAVAGLATCYPHWSWFKTYNEFHQVTGHWAGRVSTARFHNSYIWGRGDYNFGENEMVAEKISRETDPDDTIFVWGFEPGLYSLAQRAPASRFLYDYPLMPTFESVHEVFQKQLMSDLHQNRPARVLVYTNDLNAIETSDSRQQLQANQELREFLSRNYEPAWSFGDAMCLRRKGG